MFQTLLVNPLLQVTELILRILPVADIGLALVVLAVVLRLILWPVTSLQHKQEALMHKLQPGVDKIKKQYKKTVTREQKVTEYYKSHGFHPLLLSGLSLVQLPVLIAVFVMIDLLLEPGAAYAEAKVFFVFSGAESSVVLAVFVGLSQFFRTWLAGVSGHVWGKVASLIVLPVFIGVVSLFFASALAAYWLADNILGMLQQQFIAKRTR